MKYPKKIIQIGGNFHPSITTTNSARDMLINWHNHILENGGRELSLSFIDANAWTTVEWWEI